MIKNYKDLNVWKKSMDLAVAVYRLTKKLPTEEVYILSDQMRRAAVSVPSNIAEGHAGVSSKKFVQFLYIARGSLSELETQSEIGNRLGYFTDEETAKIAQLCSDVGKMLNGLITSLSTKQ